MGFFILLSYSFYLMVVGLSLGELTADEIFVLIVEFVWSNNDGVDCIVNRVNSLKFLLVSVSVVLVLGCAFKVIILTLQTDSGVAFPEPKAFSRFLQSHSSSETMIITVFLSLPGRAFLRSEVNLSMAKSWRQRKSCPLPSNASKSVH